MPSILILLPAKAPSHDAASALTLAGIGATG